MLLVSVLSTHLAAFKATVSWVLNIACHFWPLVVAAERVVQPFLSSELREYQKMGNVEVHWLLRLSQNFLRCSVDEGVDEKGRSFDDILPAC